MHSEQVQPEQGTLAHRFVVWLVTQACRCPRLVLLTALILSAGSIYLFCTRLQYRTQRSDLISPKKDYQRRWQQYLDEFGNDEDMVVVVQGKDRERMKAALDALAARVQQQPDQFDRLFYRLDLRHLRNRALLYLPMEQIEKVQANLQRMQPLLEIGPLAWTQFTLERLVREARDRAKKLQPGQPLSAGDQVFLSQLLAISKTATATAADPGQYHNPWQSLLEQPTEQQDLLAEPQYFFSGDGELAFLLVRPVKEEGSFTASQKSVDAMRAIVEELRPTYGDLRLGLTGLPVLETDEMVASQNDTALASWLALAGVTLLFFVVYRSVYYPLLTVSTLLLGTTWAMGWLTLTVGHLNILSATFAVMLIGMGDYGVLWVMRYEFERRRGADGITALQRTAFCVGAGTLTAAVTTALAFYAAMLADFQAVAELGWIAGSGVLLCALACFTVLPAVLCLCDRRVPANMPTILPLAPRTAWLPRLAGHYPWVLGVSAAVMAVFGYFAWHVSYDHNLLHLQARDLDSVKWELTLIDHTAGASWHALSYTATPEEALALKKRYEQLPEVSRVVEVASLVPAEQDKKLALLQDIQHRLRNLPERGVKIPHLTPSGASLKHEVAGLVEQLQSLTGQPLLADLRQTLAALQQHLPDDMASNDVTPNVANSGSPAPQIVLNVGTSSLVNTRLQDFEEQMTRDLASDLHRLRDVSTPAPIVLADLPGPLRERYLGLTGKWLLQVFGKDSLWDFEKMEHFADRISTVDPEATGKPFATVDGLRGMKDGFQWAGIYAFGAIAIVLLGDFRNPGHTLIALAPLAMGVTLALGIMGLLGMPLNPANTIALPLILGVGVDNGVHVLHDFLASRLEGRSVVSRAIARGVLVKALTTMIGFGTLMISSHRGLVGLGFILTLGVGCCMVTALVFLPVVLQGWGRQAAKMGTAETSVLVQRAA